jgi:hypothetical protein
MGVASICSPKDEERATEFWWSIVQDGLRNPDRRAASKVAYRPPFDQCRNMRDDVCFWHKADIPIIDTNVRFRQ